MKTQTVIALFTPILAGLAGWCVQAAAEHLPGTPTLDQANLTTLFVAGAAAGAAAGVKLLHDVGKAIATKTIGDQRVAAAQANAVAVAARGSAKVFPGSTLEQDVSRALNGLSSLAARVEQLAGAPAPDTMVVSTANVPTHLDVAAAAKAGRVRAKRTSARKATSGASGNAAASSPPPGAVVS